MWRNILLFGVVGGVLIALLELVEYRFLVIDHSLEMYGGIVAALFSGLGIWLGLRITARRQRVVVREVAVPAGGPFVRDDQRRAALGITRRELEILELIADGLSTREIAARLFVSENTVKSHSNRLFAKLAARRRTEAVRIGKEAGLIP
jgi:two-component system, NarL family, response regulator LiaR